MIDFWRLCRHICLFLSIRSSFFSLKNQTVKNEVLSCLTDSIFVRKNIFFCWKNAQGNCVNFWKKKLRMFGLFRSQNQFRWNAIMKTWNLCKSQTRIIIEKHFEKQKIFRPVYRFPFVNTFQLRFPGPLRMPLFFLFLIYNKPKWVFYYETTPF